MRTPKQNFLDLAESDLRVAKSAVGLVCACSLGVLVAALYLHRSVVLGMVGSRLVVMLAIVCSAADLAFSLAPAFAGAAPSQWLPRTVAEVAVLAGLIAIMRLLPCIIWALDRRWPRNRR